MSSAPPGQLALLVPLQVIHVHLQGVTACSTCRLHVYGQVVEWCNHYMQNQVMPALDDMQCFHVALRYNSMRPDFVLHHMFFACADACMNGAVCVRATTDGSASAICTPFLKGAATAFVPQGQV